MVTGKASSMGATVCTCYDQDGLPLASFEFYGELLVRSDGMYYVVKMTQNNNGQNLR